MSTISNTMTHSVTLGSTYTSPLLITSTGDIGVINQADILSPASRVWTIVGQGGTAEASESSVGITLLPGRTVADPVPLAAQTGLYGQAAQSAVTRTWASPGAYGNWGTTTNWTPIGAPAAGDDVVIPGSVSNTVVTLDIAATPALDSVTVGGTSGSVAIRIGNNLLDVTGTGPGATDTVTLAPSSRSLVSTIGGGTLRARNLVLGNNGYVSGVGSLTITGNISGGGTIKAGGPKDVPGTLAVSGTIEAGVHLLIAEPSPNYTQLSVLEIVGTATSSYPIGVSYSYQMLEIGQSGSLTINAAQTIGGGQFNFRGAGTVKLDGAGSRLILGSHPLTIGTGGTLTGAGTVGTSSIAGSGTVSAVGALELTPNIDAATGLTFDIQAGSRLQLDGAVGSGNTFTFLSASQAALGLANDSGFDGTLSGMSVGTGTALTDFVDIETHAVTISSETGHGTNNGTISLSDGSVLRLGNLSANTWFAHTAGDGVMGTDVFVTDTPVCFCRGTRILTERGEVAIEELTVGDRVATLSGILKRIVWIGFGRDLVIRANKLARPIVVRQGALQDGVPARDLRLTHGHALYFAGPEGGALIPVEHLVNHKSIAWDETARVVEYYHIELDDHDVVFAEGVAAETYYDAGNRALFHNARQGSAAGGDKPLFAPVLHDGAIVGRVWAALCARAGCDIAGDTTDDPDLHLMVGARRLDPASAADDVYTFTVDRPPAGPLLLRSRSGVPSLLGRSRHEHRRLGVAIRQLILQRPGVITVFDADAPLFRNGGCHAPEAGLCWTEGELVLPPELFRHLHGAFTLIVHTKRQQMRYPLTVSAAVAA